MERKFAIKGILENKKRFAMTFCVMLLAAFLLQFCTVLRSSLNNTMDENRYNTYGTFEFYTKENIGFSIKSKVDACESITRVGTLCSVGLCGELPIGYADNNALEMGRIRLLEGRMPETDNEIVLERSFLEDNGLTVAPGEKIKLNIELLQDPENDGEPENKEIEFLLCGILNEYTESWGFGLSGLIFADGSDRSDEFLKSTYGSIRQRIYLFDAAEHPNVPATLKNYNAYPKESLYNVTTLLSYAVLMAAAVSASVLLVCVIFSVLKRTDTWRFFRDLGAEKGQIQKIVLWEGVYLSVPALLIGAVLGVVCTWLLMFIIPSPIGEKWYFQINMTEAAVAFGLSAFAVAIGVVIPSFLVRKTPLLMGEKKVRVKKYGNRRKQGVLSVLRLITDRMRAQRAVTVLLIVIMLSSGLSGAFVINTVSGQLNEIAENGLLSENGELILDRTYERIDGMYDFFSIAGMDNFQKHFSYENTPLHEDVIKEIEAIYGVEEVKRYMIKFSDYARHNSYCAIPPYRPSRDADGYCSNTALEQYGGVSSLLYMDLSDYEDTVYFSAYISGEKARAAYSLEYCEEWSHPVAYYFGKAMSYHQPLDTNPPSYGEHMLGKGEPTEKELSEYYAQYHVLQWDEMIADTENCNATVWGVNGAEAEPILQSAEGRLDLSAYESGEECILVLPDIYFVPKELDPEPNYPPLNMDHNKMDWLYKYENRDVGFDFDIRNTLFSDNAKMQGYKLYKEDSVQVGDVIPVKYMDETVEVKVGAVLRQMPKAAASYPYSTLRPYTIITGESFFDRFSDFNVSDAYECVTVKLNGKQMSSVIEEQIKKIMLPTGNWEMILSNMDSNRQAMMQEAWVNISTLLLFAVLYFAVVLVVLSIIFSISMESQRRRIAVLRALGMEVKKIQLSYLIESLFYSVSGFIGAVLIMLTVWGIVQYKTFGNGGPWLSYIVSNGCLNFMWWAYGLVFLAVTVGVLCTLYLPLRKFFKDNIIEQLQS